MTDWLTSEKFAVYMDTGQTETIFAELVADRSDSIFMIIGHGDDNNEDDDDLIIC